MALLTQRDESSREGTHRRSDGVVSRGRLIGKLQANGEFVGNERESSTPPMLGSCVCPMVISFDFPDNNEVSLPHCVNLLQDSDRGRRKSKSAVGNLLLLKFLRVLP